MSIILPALAVAFAAFCVWLGVRIFNRRERWAKWTLAAVVGLPLLYVASFGPACWWFSPRVGLTGDCVDVPAVYLPIGRIYIEADHGGWISRTIRWYATLRHESVQVMHNGDFNARLQIERTD